MQIIPNMALSWNYFFRNLQQMHFSLTKAVHFHKILPFDFFFFVKELLMILLLFKLLSLIN